MSVAELNQRIYKQNIGGEAVSLLLSINEAALRVPHDYKAIEDFFLFSSHFFDRIFGEATTGCKNLPEGWQSIKYGGWLKEFGTVNQLSSNLNGVLASGGDAEGSDVRQLGLQSRVVNEKMDKLFNVLQLTLSFNSNMMDVLKRGRMFIMPQELLPRRARMLSTDPAWINYVQNSDPIHDFLISWARKTQEAASVEGTVSLPPLEYFFICLARYPTMNATAHDLPQSFRDAYKHREESKIYISMGMKVPMQPYNVLLYRYLTELLPHGGQPLPEGILFLHLVVETWIASALVNF